MRDKHNFAYFTGCNRPVDYPIIESLIRSARVAGVPEDIHCFSPAPVGDSIHHPIPSNTDWRSHMAKLDFLRQLKDTSYNYVIWLDSDSYFVRDPGDFSSLIRSNKCFVSMEGEITGNRIKQKDWWGMKFPSQIIDVMRSHCGSQRLWNTNGGFWIVRVDAIAEFADKCEQVFSVLKPQFKDATDEPPLACAAMSMIPDSEFNTTLFHAEKWAADWGGRIYKNRLPDGNPWLYEEWLTGIQHTINPAIIHAMGSKNTLRSRSQSANYGQPLSTIQKVVSAAQVMGATLINGGQYLSQEKIDARLAKCQQCPNFTGSGCTLCGCPANRDAALTNKLAHPSAICPAYRPQWFAEPV